MSRCVPFSLRLEIDAAEPISGRLHGDHGPALTFAGWLGLASAIERALRAAESHEEKMRDGPS